MRGAMSIAGRCRDRALLLQQIAQECLCPLFKARAIALAAQWLILATLADQTGVNWQAQIELDWQAKIELSTDQA
jgi:hypothetical protein